MLDISSERAQEGAKRGGKATKREPSKRLPALHTVKGTAKTL